MQVEDIKKIACVGAGIIGSSWATLFARNGYTVNIYDAFPEGLKGAQKKIMDNYNVFVKNGFMSKEQVDEAMARIVYFSDLAEAIKEVQFIQESAPEILELKQEMVSKMDAINPTAVVCSSTSGLNISDITSKSSCVGRYVGGHPYNPPHLMPLVELTKWEKTDESYVKLAYDFYKSLKKEPVVLKKESPGFICNRLQAAFVKEAIAIVMDGVCDIEDLDKASVYGLGIRWAILGPNLNGQLNGGAGGIRDYFGKYKQGWNRQFKRLMASDIHEVPEVYHQEIAPKGVELEMKNRPSDTGNTTQEVLEYRDKILLKILSLHNKL